MTAWQPIETAPKDGTRVDLWAGYRVADAAWKHHHYLNGSAITPKTWVPNSPHGPQPNPTHWMPLPEPPQ